MDEPIKAIFHDLGSTDDKIRLNALQSVLSISEDRVDWIYDVWDDLLNKLENENSYQRSIGIMLLCNLAKSDTQNRIGACLNRILKHTRDEKFITSRQCIQNIWKIAAACEGTRGIIIDHLEKRFIECASEKHSNLLRQDIVQSLWSLYKVEKDEKISDRINRLILEEPEDKYRKKYISVLKE